MFCVCKTNCKYFKFDWDSWLSWLSGGSICWISSSCSPLSICFKTFTQHNLSLIAVIDVNNGNSQLCCSPQLTEIKTSVECCSLITDYICTVKTFRTDVHSRYHLFDSGFCFMHIGFSGVIWEYLIFCVSLHSTHSTLCLMGRPKVLYKEFRYCDFLNGEP